MAERLQVGMNQAFVLLRGYVRNGERRLSEIAGALIDGALVASDLRSA